MEFPPSVQSLPSDVLVKILEFAELHETILLASSSKLMQELVFKQCEPLWVHINFGNGSPQMRARLTDTMLTSLLVRVDARNITQSLSLFPMGTFRGFGLAPLSYSNQLRSVRLETRLGDGFQMDTALSILRTMIPLQLFHVRFGSHQFPRHSNTTLCFLRDLRTAKVEQASTQRIT